MVEIENGYDKYKWNVITFSKIGLWNEVCLSIWRRLPKADNNVPKVGLITLGTRT